MKYFFNRFSVFLAILMIVATVSFSEYRSYQITKLFRSRLSEVCWDHNIMCTLEPRPTWISDLAQKLDSVEYVNYKSVDALVVWCDNGGNGKGIPEVAKVASEMWDISEIRLEGWLPSQDVVDELQKEYPSILLIDHTQIDMSNRFTPRSHQSPYHVKADSVVPEHRE